MCCVRTIHGGAGYSYYARRIQYSYYASSTVFESVVSKTKSKHSHVYESYKNSKTVTHYSYILDAANLLRGYLVIMFSRRKRKRKKLRFLMGHKHCSWRACFNSFLHLPVFGLMWTGIPYFGNCPNINQFANSTNIAAGIHSTAASEFRLFRQLTNSWLLTTDYQYSGFYYSCCLECCLQRTKSTCPQLGP